VKIKDDEGAERTYIGVGRSSHNFEMIILFFVKLIRLYIREIFWNKFSRIYEHNF